ncbi:DUF2207 domain-containing protein [Nocardioides terrisoli]|uniref:DUF2207 domain-containing protein n=1 Tax=Nocardioides terrisoli TaxID=3388267 RepID=UPI00287BBEF2|nr:DUF2207 domain-containing protein [Nocardioides marmorisolisilvae]
MKRLVVRAVALVVLALLVSVPAWGLDTSSGSGSSEDTEITNYVADFHVARNGDLDVVEDISVFFPVGVAKHGIFRFFDTHDPSAPHARRIPEDIRVQQDGSPASVDLSWRNNRRERVLRIGDADRYVDSGRHTYRISYRIPGVLEPGSGGARTQFYWNLIPGGWAQPIDKATLRVFLPADATGVRCALGNGAVAGCAAAGAGTPRLIVRTGPLAPYTPVTVTAGLDVPTPPVGHELPWTGRWDGVLGQSVPTLIAIAVLAALAAALGLLAASRSREDDPGFPLQYAPPDGIGPAQGNYLRTERIDQTAFVASVMYAAERGAVALSRDDGSWTIADTGKGWDRIDEATAQVSALVGGPHGSFTASSSSVADGQRLKSVIGSFETAVPQWALQSGNLVKAGLGGFGGFLVLAGLVLAVLNVFFDPFDLTVLSLVPGLFAIGALALLAPGASTRRTAIGRQLWSRVGGFHRVLSTPSAEARFDFSGRKELYTAYLPWAVAFGCADEWAKKYRTEVGAEPPLPAYFVGMYSGDHTGNFVDSMVSSFSSTVDAAISSYEATQSSSSSGGGFSGGGGGGGGGGGSW